MHTSTVPQPAFRPSYPRGSETLPDHGYLRIRPANPCDGRMDHDFLEHRSSGACRYRLLGLADYPRRRLIDQPADIAYVDEVAFVAVTPEDSRERIVGASRYRTDAGHLHCECTVMIDDAWQDKGLAALLMKHLMEVARAQGIRRMFSVDLAADVQMKALTAQLGFRIRMDPGDARQVVHELEL